MPTPLDSPSNIFYQVADELDKNIEQYAQKSDTDVNPEYLAWIHNTAVHLQIEGTPNKASTVTVTALNGDGEQDAARCLLNWLEDTFVTTHPHIIHKELYNEQLFENAYTATGTFIDAIESIVADIPEDTNLSRDEFNELTERIDNVYTPFKTTISTYFTHIDNAKHAGVYLEHLTKNNPAYPYAKLTDNISTHHSNIAKYTSIDSLVQHTPPDVPQQYHTTWIIDELNRAIESACKLRKQFDQLASLDKQF